MLLYLAARSHFEDWPSFSDEWAAAVMIYGTALSIVPAMLLIIRYRRFMRLEKQTQHFYAVCACVWDLLLFMVFLGQVFRIFR
jgi:hypothetical protein